MSVSGREKFLLFALSILIVLFAGIHFLVMPFYNSATHTAVDVLALRQSKATASQKADSVSKTEAAVKTELGKANSAASPLLPQLDIDRLNVWLVNLVQQSGISVNTVNFSGPNPADVTTSAPAAKGNTTGTASGNSAGDSYLLGQYAEGYKGTASAPAVPAAQAGTKTASSSATSSSGTSSGSQAAATPGVQSVSVDLSLTGNYAQANAFLDIVKNSGKTVRITAFSCSTANGTYQITATLQCFGAEKPDDSDATFNWTLPAPGGTKSIM